MTKFFRLIWIGFLSVFPTTKLLENVENEIENIFDETKKQKRKTESEQKEPAQDSKN